MIQAAFRTPYFIGADGRGYLQWPPTEPGGPPVILPLGVRPVVPGIVGALAQLLLADLGMRGREGY